MKLKQPKTKEQAREQAINFSVKFNDKQFSYYELMKVSEHFEKTGKQFGLLDEFKENGIV
tara:strand:- start:624 stop:803 length:180 start_codon:yes stop_codon:yes gene_type:complete